LPIQLNIGDSVDIQTSSLGLYSIDLFGRMKAKGYVSNRMQETLLLEMNAIPCFGGSEVSREG